MPLPTNVTVNTVADGVYLAGDFSGIQCFVLRVKSAGKAQAKRLRARSFLLELVERAALWHVEQRFHTSDDDVLIRGGGGFLVRLQANADRAQLERLETDLQRMLWDEFGGELQFALGWAATPADARAALERRKRQPGRSVLQSHGSWDVQCLTRPSLAEPCEVCGEFPGFRNRRTRAAVSAWPGPRVWAAHVERRYHARAVPSSDSPRR